MTTDGLSTGVQGVRGRRHIGTPDHMMSDGVSAALKYGVDAEQGGHRRYIGARDHMVTDGTSSAVPAPEGPKHIAVADHLVAADVTQSGDAWMTTGAAQPEGREHIGLHENPDDFVNEGFVSTADARYLGESGPEKYSGHKVHYRNRDHSPSAKALPPRKWTMRSARPNGAK